MSNAIFSAFIGLIFLCLTFCLCFFTVIGVKYAWICFKSRHDKSRNTEQETEQVKKVKTKRTYKPIKSIEINPEEVDRIYVKKSS